MYKDSAGKMVTEWVTLMPDEDWKNGDRKFFSGRALVRDWAGEFIRYYSYTKDGMFKSTKISEVTANEKVTGGVQYGQFCYDYSYNCDPPTYPTVRTMYDIKCTSSVCVPVIEWEDEPWVPVTVGGGTGWTGSGPSSSAPSSGGPAGGEYVPYQCDASLPQGTSVSPNQAPPCQTFVSAGGLTMPPLTVTSFAEYSSLDDVIADPQLYPIWNRLNESEKQFFRDNWELAPSGLVNYGIVIGAGEILWQNPDEDNSNANAFRHALLTGLNSLAWNSETLAKEFGRRHELNGGQTQNQHEMDRLNNEAGAVFSRTYKLPDDLLFAILFDFEEQFPKLKRLAGNSASGAIISTSTEGRKYPPGYIEIP